MNFIDHTKIAFASLMSNKSRTFLTTLGIIIGVASVVTLLTFGKGTQNSIESQFDDFGPNNIYILAGESSDDFGGGPPTFTETFSLNEADEFRSYDKKYVTSVTGYTQASFRVASDTKDEYLQVVAYFGDYSDGLNIKVESGNLIADKEIDQKEKVAMIGPDLIDKLFDGQNPLGQDIKISNTKFRVIGITESKSGSSFDNPNEYVSIPFTTYEQYLSNSGGIPFLVATARSKDNIEEAKDEATKLLRRVRDIGPSEEDNFQVRDAGEILNQISQITGFLTIFLAAIAAISLVVGGIGVMNIMFVSITERTKEIGLRKSLGAKNNDILLQFLSESMVVSILGGFIGIILGLVLSWWLSDLAGFVFKLYTDSIFLAIIFTLFIGFVFGIYPARKASKLNPIDALRYE